ncbi:MAG: zinc ribbon domain-containing protein [Pirellulales bacterium]|nr:zinc ribbon domain-containing protein [Pirellulales bacterium]
MSIRVVCSNGHKFNVGPEFLQKSKKCPKCRAEYTWVFRLKCSKGHSLKVPGKYAGQTGKCPECGEIIRVPEVGEPESAETLVSNLLHGVDESLDASGSAIIGGDGGTAPMESWQTALAELGGLKDGSTSRQTEEKKNNGGNRSLQDAMGDGEDGWKTRQCPHCKQFVDPSRRSCEACGKYIGVASAEEIARSQRCSSCGVMSYPGATACTACGVPFE